jgi:hypothetical protein
MNTELRIAVIQSIVQELRIGLYMIQLAYIEVTRRTAGKGLKLPGMCEQKDGI